MQKRISLIIFIGLLLISCNIHEKGKESISAEFKLISGYDLLEPEHNGMFVISPDDRLDFADFDSLASVPVCDDPTCKHQHPDVEENYISDKDCHAYGKNNHPFIYNDKLYYFRTTDYTFEDNKYYQSTDMWQCSINGADNRKICSFDKLVLPTYSKAMLYDSKVWLLMTRQPYDMQMKDLEPSIELVSADLESREVQTYGTVKSSYSIGGRMIGVSGGKVIFEVNYPETNMPFMDKVSSYAEEHGISETDAMIWISGNEKYCFDQYEVSRDSFVKCEEQDLFGITEKGCYYFDNGNLRFVGANGAEKLYDIDAAGGGFYDVGEYLHIFNAEKAYLIDEEKLEFYPLKDKPDIVYVKDGKAIIRDYTNDKKPFKKVAVSELKK